MIHISFASVGRLLSISGALVVAAMTVSGVSAQPTLDYPSAWNCDVEKWHWYCDPPPAALAPPAKATKSVKPDPKSQPASVQKTERVELKDIKTAVQLREELKRREDVAIMQPTVANIRDFLEVHVVVQNKSSDFADSWRRVVWQNPDLDYAQKHPVNNTGVRLAREKKDADTDQHLAELAKEHGLLFFFRSDCPYCNSMLPVLEMLRNKYGMEVLAISTDNAPLPGMKQFNVNRGQFEKLLEQHGLREARVPALFIASKKTGDTAPLGMGVMAFTEIVDRMFVLTGTQVGDEF
jgi:conjugal transfer pilus assembly protein TraF